jgi:hypothetical protein
MSKGNTSPIRSGRPMRALERALDRAFGGTETKVIGSPVILGCGLFELAVLSPALGCHLFVQMGGSERDARCGQAVAMLERLRAASRRAGWRSVHGWVVDGPETAANGEPSATGLMLWPRGAERTPDAARATLLQVAGARRPSIAERRAAMQTLATAFVDPLGAFDPVTPRNRRQRGHGALRSELDDLDRWLASRTLAEEQSRLTQLELEGELIVVQGPAGSGKTTVLARHAARTIHSIAGAVTSGASDGRPTLLVTARTKSAAAQLRARVVAAYRRWTGATRLPRWVDTMDLPEAVKRIRAQRDAGGAPTYQWIMVDEAQELDAEWWNWLLRYALREAPRSRGVLACADGAQRIHEKPAPMAEVSRVAGLAYRIVDLQTTYRSPRQVIEPAFNVLHGTFAHAASTTAAREPERLALLRECRADLAPDGWLRVRFAMRGIGIPGAPAGAMPRMVRASNPRAAYATAIRDAVSLVDVHGAAPTDIVIVAVDQRAALAAARAAAAAGHAGRFTRATRSPSEAPQDRIRILRVSDCRGHDFPVALVVGIERLSGAFVERTLLYQAATRAQHLLIAYGVEGQGLSDELGECILREAIELE